MTDNEIIKALECCSTATCITNKCPYESICDIPTCTTKLTKDALDLIKRQKAEIENYEREAREAFDGLMEVLQTARPKHESDIARAKAEAVNEFAERLKEDISGHRLEMYMNGLKGTPRMHEITYECVEEYIDNLVTEMVGGNDVHKKSDEAN